MTDDSDPAEFLRSLLKDVDPSVALRCLYESDATPEDKCDIALNILKLTDQRRVPELFHGLRETIFDSTEARTHMMVRAFTNHLRSRPGPLGGQLALEAMAESLAMASTLLESFSAAAAEEVGHWRSFFREMASNLPEWKMYHCAHCGAGRDDMYTVMDGWVLCSISDSDAPSCFTRVHDYGEALGSAMINGDD